MISLNPNLWNIGGFDYALAIIKIVLLFITYFYISFFASLWLKDQNENKATRLFVLSLPYYFSSH